MANTDALTQVLAMQAQEGGPSANQFLFDKAITDQWTLPGYSIGGMEVDYPSEGQAFPLGYQVTEG